MSVPNSDKNLGEDLEWISMSEEKSWLQRKGIFGVLVPIGCATTVGILLRGLYFLMKKDSKKQQILMRYRVLAQGITIGLATIGIMNVRTTIK